MNARPRLQLKLDLNSAIEIAMVGVRRASAFLHVGSRALEGDPPEHYQVGEKIIYEFLPKSACASTWDKVSDEYGAWLVGACLVELDQYFSLFLNEVLYFVEIVHKYSSELSLNDIKRIRDKIFNGTSVSKKVSRLAELLGVPARSVEFSSITHARNALIHGAGRLRHRDGAIDGELEVRWLATDVVVVDGDKHVSLRDIPDDGYRIENDEGGEVWLKFIPRSRTFKVGERVKFTQQDLAEICAFFGHEAETFRQAVRRFAEDRGIPLS